MIRLRTNTQQFMKDMSNIVGYAEGFLQGVEQSKPVISENLGAEVLAALKEYIDANARVSPMTLHHVYEWYQTGSPAARLFDIKYSVNGSGLSFNSTFRQSVSVKEGSKTPFYNKAEIMERGIPVRIAPVASEVLVFEDNGEKVFTRKPVTVSDPGGQAVQGSYERVFDSFFNQYFSQSFIRHSGVLNHLKDAKPFAYNFNKAKRGGKSAGISVGIRWASQGGR